MSLYFFLVFVYWEEGVNGGFFFYKSGVEIIFFLVFIRNKIECGWGRRGGLFFYRWGVFIGFLGYFVSLIGRCFFFLVIIMITIYFIIDCCRFSEMII